jgi:flagellar basal-body rod protein FlgF
MINASYIGISAQLALQRRMDTISHNVANASTAGFRAEHIRFASALAGETSTSVAFATTGETHLARHAGEISQTGNPLDVAVEGDAWLSVATPDGTALSRDGRMQMTETGELRTLTGHPVLDAGGAPIRLDPSQPQPSIARDGTITQGTRRVAVLGLFTVDPQVRLKRGVDATVHPETPAEPAVDQTSIGVRQGFVERSNVNAITEMSRLILDQRLFEAITGAMNDTDQTKQEAIRALGAGS